MSVLHKANPSRVYLDPEQHVAKFVVQNMRDWPTQEQTMPYHIAPGIQLEPVSQSVYEAHLVDPEGRLLPLKYPKRLVMRVMGHSTEHVTVDFIPRRMMNKDPEMMTRYLQLSLECKTEDDFVKLAQDLALEDPDEDTETAEEAEADQAAS